MRPVICCGTWPGEQGVPLWVHRFEGLTFNRCDDSPQMLYDLDPPSVLSTRHLQRGNTIYACDLSDDDHRYLAARRHGVQPRVSRLGGVMSKQRVSLNEIRHAIQCLEAGGERPSIRRVQQEIRYDYAGVSELMRTHRLTQTNMNRMAGGRHPRPRQKPGTRQHAKPQKRRAGQDTRRGKPLSAQAPELSLEPYKAFLTAILDQAIRDVGSRSLDYRRAAWRWLRAHPDCVEICEWLDLDHRLLIKALESRGAA